MSKSNLTPTLFINGDGVKHCLYSPSPFMERVGVRLLFDILHSLNMMIILTILYKYILYNYLFVKGHLSALIFYEAIN